MTRGLSAYLLMALVAAALGVFVHGCFLLAAYVAGRVDADALESSLREAQENGSFPIETRTYPSDTHDIWSFGLHTYMECRIFSQAARQAEDKLAQAITPLDLGGGPERSAPCEALFSYLRTADRSAWGRGYRRHRYLHGLRPIILIGTTQLGVIGIRSAVVGLNYILVLLILGVAATRTLHSWPLSQAGDRRARSVLSWAISMAILTASFTLFGAVPLHARSLCHGVPNGVLLGFLLLGTMVNLNTLRLTWLVGLAASLGAVVVHLDYMIGSTPLGLAMLLAVLAVQPGEGRLSLRSRRVAVVVVSYSAAVVGVLLAKHVVASLYFGPEVWMSLLSKLDQRTGFAQFPIDVALVRFVRSSRFLALGSPTLGVAALVGGLGVAFGPFFWAWWRSTPGEETPGLSLLAISALIVFLWYAIFWNHAVQHARFMISLLAWPIAAGLTATGAILLRRSW